MYFRPVRLTVSSSRSSSSMDMPAGTALMTCLPAFMASISIQTCSGNGVNTATASRSGCFRHLAESLIGVAAPVDFRQALQPVGPNVANRGDFALRVQVPLKG